MAWVALFGFLKRPTTRVDPARIAAHWLTARVAAVGGSNGVSIISFLQACRASVHGKADTAPPVWCTRKTDNGRKR